jgi:ATP-dependent Clp endopeptidase proteolytic subunit ClpP
MPKRSLDYNLGLPRKLKKKPKSDENEEPEGEEINPEEIMCDFMGMTDSVTIRENNIYFYCGVNKKNIVKLITAINDVTKRLKIMEIEYGVSDLKINLHINSFGGSVFAALSAIDTIMANDIPIVSIVEGGAASAATLISVVCQERRITPNSFMLVHQLSSGFWGKMEEIKDEFLNLKKLMKTLTKLYKKHTSIDDSDETTLKDLLKRDLWLSANECLKYGMVDTVE